MENKGKTNIKEILSNKRYRALIKLGLYGIFFLVVIVLFKSNNNPVNNVLTPLEKFNNYNLYKYSANINYYLENELISLKYEGINYSDKSKIIYNDDIYYFNQGKLSSDESNLNKILNLIMDINPQIIYNEIKDLSVLSKTEIYSENLISKEYLTDSILEVPTYINTYENENEIIKIKLRFDYFDQETNTEYNRVEVLINYELDKKIKIEEVTQDGE